MALTRLISRLTVAILFVGLFGCQTGDRTSVAPVPPASLLSTVPPSVEVPHSIERLAVLHPRSNNGMLRRAYAHLEGLAFQLKEQRPRLKMVERAEIQTLLAEHEFQLDAPVSEETAIHVGRLLGVDSVLFYRIDGPTLRDRVFARFDEGRVPPFVIITKVINVESAEIMFHNAVISPVTGGRQDAPLWSNETSMQPAFQDALDKGIAQASADLQHAFR